MERYLHTGIPHVIHTVYDIEGLRKDGGIFPCELSVAESGETGGRRFFVGILRDVSERRRGEEALRSSEQSYRQLFENASDAIVLFQPRLAVAESEQASGTDDGLFSNKSCCRCRLLRCFRVTGLIAHVRDSRRCGRKEALIVK